MLKKILLLLCGMLIVISEAYASPAYLSVTGTIDQITGYPVGTYATGDILNFTVMYDYEQSGYQYKGTTIQTPGSSYYAEYIGGDALSFDPSYYPFVNQYNYPHYGVDVSNQYYQFYEQHIYTSTDIYSDLEIYRSRIWHGGSGGFDSWEWEVGDTLAIRTSNNREGIYLNGYVSSLSETNPFNPVPLPSTISLLGLGLLGLVGLRRKKQK